MQTECCECDRPASRFIGTLPYCSTCAGKVAHAGQHECPRCGETQPPNVLWRGDAPCTKCQAKEGRR